MKMKTLVSYLLSLLLWWMSSAQEADDLKRLFDDKIWSYNPYIRPVLNQTDQMNVTLQLHLVAITNFDEVSENLSFTAWLDLVWHDPFLVWDPIQYGGSVSIHPPAHQVWRPNIAVANTMSTFNPVTDSTNLVHVLSNGTVTWKPGANFDVYCEVDTSSFPFDVQECLVELLLWDYHLEAVDLLPMASSVGVSSFRANGKWALVSTDVSKEIRQPDTSSKPAVVMTLKLKRRPEFVLINIILPTALLSILNSCVFLIPADSGEKICFAVTILLAYGVLMSYITNMLPKTSKTTSSLSIIMVASLVVSSVFVGLAIVITRLYKKTETEVPVNVAHVTRLIERILCRRKKNECQSSDSVSRSEPQDSHDSIDKVVQTSSISLSSHVGNDGRCCHGEDVMTWKRVSKCLDMALFVVCFPALLVAAVAVMGNDCITLGSMGNPAV
ncbi:acetylcholine receptor subunit alpha-type acr-16-like [Haliotis rufescens]|uniref:acetylcholine receptor subunit alpha-type acr-16-like n=1 Tax=Haliotis rufescens TaxID=6454 RepID=UPI00201F5F02|nr:acetylcholine receptor subunit alpha-type acr-16-like [Haliotis rufescens]